MGEGSTLTAGVRPARADAPGVQCRRIEAADLEGVASLLQEGFPRRPRQDFVAALAHLGAWPEQDGQPRYGYVLAAGAQLVGVLLTLFSPFHQRRMGGVRCNVSCWYVQPAFRMYGALLASRLPRGPGDTIVNISPAPYTWKTIEAQGFKRLSEGVYAGLPAIAPKSSAATVDPLERVGTRPLDVTPDIWRMLQDHAAFGCISLICRNEGRSTPFVFRRRVAGHVPIPCAQLMYCPAAEDLSRFARPIGIHLALRGMPLLLVAADGPVENMPGRFFPDRAPMYFKGATRPAAHDLAYTEAVLFGF
jgi:hypothetical protein